jgi:hypothetical protein
MDIQDSTNGNIPGTGKRRENNTVLKLLFTHGEFAEKLEFAHGNAGCWCVVAAEVPIA